MINSKKFCATASKNKTNDTVFKFMFSTLRSRLCRFQFFRNLGGGLGCGKVLHRLPICLALKLMNCYTSVKRTLGFFLGVCIKEVNNCTYVMTFASSMKSSLDMAPSFIILTATGISRNHPCLTVCCTKNEYLSIIIQLLDIHCPYKVTLARNYYCKEISRNCRLPVANSLLFYQCDRCLNCQLFQFGGLYSETCIKRTPSIKQTVAEVPKFISLIYFK